MFFKPKDYTLIPNRFFSEIKCSQLGLLAYLAMRCKVVGYDKSTGTPIRESFKVGAQDLGILVKRSRQTVVKILKELQSMGFISQKFEPSEVREIEILDSPSG